MTECWMYGREAGEAISSWECPVCRRDVTDGEPGVWCFECFREWYDGELPSPDNLSPIKIGNHVRNRHGLPPLEPQQ